MTKIEEPVLAPSKKRSWSATHHARTPLFPRHDGCGGVPQPYHQVRRDPSAAADAKGATAGPALPSPVRHPGHTMDMQSVLERYHSLALTHQAQAKRRRLESAAREARASRRLKELATLRGMAQDALDMCTRVLRGEEDAKRDDERERREAEEELGKAESERRLAEEFLSRFRGGSGGGGATHRRCRSLERLEGGRSVAENDENEGRHMIGGIPSKFLDLSHFPKLKKSFELKKSLRGGGGAGRKHDRCDVVFSSDEVDGNQKRPPIIDCTNESASPRRHSGGHEVTHFPTRIPSFGVPQEVALTSSNTQSKQNTKRIYISRASLSHANGTYVQEGRYNDAPLFVRVGPPRKFMGKWDCSVVLRREEGTTGAGGHSTGGGVAAIGHVWKIGLVPAHRITHPRIIGYYAANEEPGKGAPKRVSNADRMDEDDDDDDDESTYFEPPVEGWRVLQDSRAGDGGLALGRASGLMVSYEE